MIAKRPVLPSHLLEGICKLLGDTTTGFTGTEIAKLLANSNIIDVDPSLGKWRRLYNAFARWQNSNQCSNHILRFIQLALQPVSYLGKEELFEDRRNEVNKMLSFVGIVLTEKGKFREVAKAETIAEAEQRSNKLKYKLENRNTHIYIYNYCKPELLVENYFHAVFEATKSIADRIRMMTGLNKDGNALAEIAFSKELPLITINSLLTDSERSEQTGLCNLIKAVFGLIRNPTAHEPKLKFNINEEEALDRLTTISFIHKLLDKAEKKT